MAYTLQKGNFIQFLAGDNAINILCNGQKGSIRELELTFKNLNLGGGVINFKSLQVKGWGEDAISDNASAVLCRTFDNLTPNITTEGAYTINNIHTDALQIIVTGGINPSFDLILANNGSQKQFFIEKI